MSEELRPCPFCGSDDMNVTVTDIFNAVWCRDCGAMVDIDDGDAINLWNTRPLEDALQKRIAELEAQLRWIPVSERLPEEDGEYLIFWQCKHGKGIEIDVYSTSLGWHDVDSDLHTHWMPLPNLPEDGN